MKLLRYGAAGKEKPGILDRQGQPRDLSGHISDIDAATLSPIGLAQLAAIDVDSLPVIDPQERLGVPYIGMSKYICIGLNYSDHAREAGMDAPTEPIIFLKAPSALCGPYDDIVRPRNSTKLDWEVELGVVISSRAQHVTESEALSFVAGYCVLNDVSERTFQFQSQQWDKGKGCDTFGPVGPFLVTADEVPDPQNLDMWLYVNGCQHQSGNTRTMIFTVSQLISYVSRFMTLQPGDIIATGTPPGVGMGIKPEAVWLQPGDSVRLGITGLGEQRQKVVQAS